MKRGTICWVNLESVSPPEKGKTRPALIISNSDQNLFLQNVVVVPISSQPGEIWPLRISLESRGKVSFAVIPGIRQVGKQRLLDTIGIARFEDLERITEAVTVYLND